MADALVELHSVPPAALARVRPIERYEQTLYEPPRWTTKPAVWERAFEIFHGPIPTDDLTFVHRDFHPGNLLWTRTRLTGIVDWQAACVGPASIDVGHCRLNLTYYDPLQADRLRTAWEQASGRTYDPWADVMSIVGALDSFRTPKRASRSLTDLESSLGRAEAALTV